MGRFQLALILQSSGVQSQQLSLGDFRDHAGQLFLHQLVRCNRAVIELFTRQRISACSFVAIHGRANHAPTNSVASLREARQRRF